MEKIEILAIFIAAFVLLFIYSTIMWAVEKGKNRRILKKNKQLSEELKKFKTAASKNNLEQSNMKPYRFRYHRRFKANELDKLLETVIPGDREQLLKQILVDEILEDPQHLKALLRCSIKIDSVSKDFDQEVSSSIYVYSPDAT